MVSPEVQDSGKFSGGRSNFSQTCSLLSKCMKEKGTFPDLKLGLTTNFQPPYKGPQYNTVNLLDGVGNEVEKKSKASSAAAQMTIFYGGQVIVFDDFPADKAKQIVMLATKASGAAARNYHAAAISPPVASLSRTESTVQNIVPTPALDSDLPIARKRSLCRFLEKRKDRIITNAPYQTSNPAVAKAAKGGKAAWLEMAPMCQWSSGH